MQLIRSLRNAVVAVATPKCAAIAYLRPYRDRRHELRANTALLPLPAAIRTEDTDTESDGLGRFASKTALDIQPSAKWRDDSVVGP